MSEEPAAPQHADYLNETQCTDDAHTSQRWAVEYICLACLRERRGKEKALREFLARWIRAVLARVEGAG